MTNNVQTLSTKLSVYQKDLKEMSETDSFFAVSKNPDETVSYTCKGLALSEVISICLCLVVAEALDGVLGEYQ